MNAAREETGRQDVDLEDGMDAVLPEATIHSIFSKQQKIFIVVMMTWAGAFSPISSNIYLPALPAIAKDIHVSIASINLTVTSYMIFQALSPMFLGNFADSSGRRPTYIICFTIYIFANLGLALQDTYAGLVVLRALQSMGGSATIALGSGVMADIVTTAERGSFIGWQRSGFQLGSALGPTLGGVLSQYFGWRSIFWFLLIASGTFLVIYIIFVPETGRSVVGNGSIPATGLYMSGLGYYQQRKLAEQPQTSPHANLEENTLPKPKFRFPNPLITMRMVVEKDVSIILLYSSLMVTLYFAVMVPFSTALTTIYGLDQIRVGLCYLFCAMLGSITSGKLLNMNFKRISLSLGIPLDKKRMTDLRHFPIERARLQVLFVPLSLAIACIIGFGWILEAQAPLAILLFVLAMIGLFLSGTMVMSGTLLVDLYPEAPSQATAALNLTRGLMSAASTAIIQYILDKLGHGWTYTLLGMLGIGFMPSLLVVMRWGPKWREERRLRVEKRTTEQEKGKANRIRQQQARGAETRENAGEIQAG